MQEKKALNVAIGRRIQSSREQAGLTQEQLAERVNRSTQFISTIERGVAGISLETLINVCDAVNASSEWILRGREAAPNVDFIAAKLSSLSAEQLILIDRLTDDLLALLEVSGEKHFRLGSNC